MINKYMKDGLNGLLFLFFVPICIGTIILVFPLYLIGMTVRMLGIDVEERLNMLD